MLIHVHVPLGMKQLIDAQVITDVIGISAAIVDESTDPNSDTNKVPLKLEVVSRNTNMEISLTSVKTGEATSVD